MPGGGSLSADPCDAVAVERLHTASEIRAVFAARRVAHGSAMAVHVRRRNDDARGRATVVAGKRVGNAVQRNRAKRRLREAVEGVVLPAGTDVVVVARTEALTIALDALRQQLEKLLDRSERRRREPAS